ncbi:hypothetical protein LOC50_10600 [Pseudoalteromonas sp. SCSIO 43095]|uniref:hypothetical protein n=1 Tax=Pseudoalteromonas sp. SCSIO 43095 TaxID=2894202 RepID=UPI00202B1A5E|nr:hypothetical protein [Pseudoalteromonas sp. SCSIO 43095]URQ98095.1 hypothetical protein LOC50_10600 [Pseudoalteromonas sp. SCSIO 43095]
MRINWHGINPTMAAQFNSDELVSSTWQLAGSAIVKAIVKAIADFKLLVVNEKTSLSTLNDTAKAYCVDLNKCKLD